MSLFTRIGAGILGAVEGYFLVGAIASQVNSVEFAGSILGGIIGGAIGFCLPIATVIPVVILVSMCKRDRGRD